MHRNIAQTLNNWKADPDRKALLLRGARQVGKTYSVRELGKSFKHFIEINFEKDLEAHTFFHGSLDPRVICQKLSLFKKTPIAPGATLLFFDELQACPAAIRSLRFFYEQMPVLHVVGAGSLLEFALEELPSFGVGRITSLFMYPMTFSEFLFATGEEQLAEHLNETIMQGPLDPVFHDKLLDILRIHMILGGMPAVVEKYRTTGEVLSCQQIIDDLLLTIRDDFAKYRARVPQTKLSETLTSIALQAGGKFKYSSIAPEMPSIAFKEALDLLVRAGLASMIYHTSGRGVPLGAQVNLKKFKVLPLDMGLFQRIAGLSLPDVIAKDTVRLVNEGPLAEVYAGLQMIAGGPPRTLPQLYYWHREARASNAEVDYVIASGEKVFGIEVKAATSGRMQSLHRFLEEDERRFGIRISHENSGMVGKIKIVPIYAAEMITREGGLS